MSVNVLVIADSPLTRQRVVRLLGAQRDIDSIDALEHGAEAVAALRAGLADVVFCEVTMPDLKGMDTLEAVEPDRLPALVLVTTYDPGILWSFQVRGIEFLLKPFDGDRLRATLDRTLDRIRSSATQLTNRRFFAAVARARMDLAPPVAIPAGGP